MKIRDIAYQGDGVQMVGYFAVDNSWEGKRPGVLIAHSGPGLGDHAKSCAQELAKLGYAAFAMDYHGGGKLLPSDADIYRLLASYMETGGIRFRAQAALDVLTAQPEVDTEKLAATGYCFGGTAVLELARDGAPLAAVFGFHSGLETNLQINENTIKGKIQVCIGSRDPIIPLQQRLDFEQEMDGAGVDWQMHILGGVEHSFTAQGIDAIAKEAGISGLKYDQLSDQRSWRLMRDLFVETFGPEKKS